MSSSPDSQYRVYCFDAASKIVSADWIDASSDEEALAKAEAKGFGSQCELWQGKRLVASLTAERRQA